MACGPPKRAGDWNSSAFTWARFFRPCHSSRHLPGGPSEPAGSALLFCGEETEAQPGKRLPRIPRYQPQGPGHAFPSCTKCSTRKGPWRRIYTQVREEAMTGTWSLGGKIQS